MNETKCSCLHAVNQLQPKFMTTVCVIGFSLISLVSDIRVPFSKEYLISETMFPVKHLTGEKTHSSQPITSWLRRLLCHPARKCIWLILQLYVDGMMQIS